MVEIIKTETFENWLLGLKDRMARFRIQARIDRLAGGDKRTQNADIEQAISISKEWKE